MERFKKKYRHETKYIVDERDIEIIKSRISPIMSLDVHNQKGSYLISSTYFDDFEDTALMQNLSGVSPRSKYRIRIYDSNIENIFLEKKTKNHDLTYKESCQLLESNAASYLNGEFNLKETSPEKLENTFKAVSTMTGMKPKIIVIYERLAYTCNVGNVRVTFDTNLSAST